MTRTFTTAALVLAVSATAQAADLPAPQPNLALPLYDWSGFYVGGHVGGAWDHRNVTIYNSITGVPLASGGTTASNVMGGGQVGYNFAFPSRWVVGIEADLSATDVGRTVIGGNSLGERVNKIDLFGTARARVGYGWNNWLLYGTGGFAWADEQMTRTQQFGIVNNATPGTVESAKATGTGWAAGAGVEWAFTRGWTARLEYLHLDLGTQQLLFPLAGQQIDPKVTIDVGRFGISYKFN
jgi:opacity protein-like surface antigen